ncbi:Ltp family lipoprotein [[Clostridium] dakarense]|uniref:Ltp family lipoprotein n=1 Tax=Faecalimicrobium dakarense TaxID=1301100 RepID=UPI0004BA28A4|nr:Ltp family lipoprotein [[Clostridium] dakarense]
MKLKKSLIALLLGVMSMSMVACSEPESEKVVSGSITPVGEKKDEVAEEDTQVEEDVPTEYKSALRKAKTYSDTMSMSKAGLYEQLTSEYGEKFPQEAAQYAIDNVEADWKENALKKAKTYQKDMAMSSSAIYDQLISDYGEKFTEEEAQYAIDNLE